MATLTWKIKSIEWTNRVGALQKVVDVVRYECEAVENDHTCYIPGNVSVGASDASSFTAYDSLTESDVLAWTKTALGSSKVNEIETAVTRIIREDIDGGRSFKHTSSLPWE
tara:strand:+ start:747 stop:1079 length:333 start_codon:yes stop_codon:yes gene_type:complete